MGDLFWVDAGPSTALAIVLCPLGPGRLRDKLLRIKENGVETLVSLLEPHEADWLGLAEEGPLAEEMGMKFLSHPIRDASVPFDSGAFRKFVADLAKRLRAGERIGLHCRGSVGRAPITASCALIHLGWKAEDAVAAVREARQGCRVPDTEEQLNWILNYKAEP